jgi:hypothetical protein
MLLQAHRNEASPAPAFHRLPTSSTPVNPGKWYIFVFTCVGLETYQKRPAFLPETSRISPAMEPPAPETAARFPCSTFDIVSSSFYLLTPG